jgi:hypothetical protein
VRTKPGSIDRLTWSSWTIPVITPDTARVRDGRGEPLAGAAPAVVTGPAGLRPPVAGPAGLRPPGATAPVELPAGRPATGFA